MIATQVCGSWKQVKPVQLNRTILVKEKKKLFQFRSLFKKKGTVRAFYCSKVVKNTRGRACGSLARVWRSTADSEATRLHHSSDPTTRLLSTLYSLGPSQVKRQKGKHFGASQQRGSPASPNAAVTSPRPPTSKANRVCESCARHRDPTVLRGLARGSQPDTLFSPLCRFRWLISFGPSWSL